MLLPNKRALPAKCRFRSLCHAYDLLKCLYIHRQTAERGVSTTLRHILTEFSEFFHVSWTGLLIQASVGTAGGLGALRTKRSG